MRRLILLPAILLVAPLLAACGAGGGVGGERAQSDSGQGDAGRGDAGQGDTGQGGARAAVQTTALTGLYEASGNAQPRSRLCIISQPSGAGTFGIVVQGANGSCSGAGQAVRSNALLRLTMSGDEQCAIEARMEGPQVTFPSALAAGCAYYCAPGASLAGTRLEKTGGTRQDAMRATDLAGDPLCD